MNFNKTKKLNITLHNKDNLKKITKISVQKAIINFYFNFSPPFEEYLSNHLPQKY